MRNIALLAVAPLLLAMGGCDSDEPAETTPPAAGAKLCDVTDASWWYDATGAGGLTGVLDGEPLPLTNPSQSPTSDARAECRVIADGKQIGSFVAELTTADEVVNTAQNIAKDPAENQFEALGNKGGVEPQQDGDRRRAWWTCGSTLLKVELIHPKDADQSVELTKALAQRVAGVVGCPGPTPTPG
jgi:hypothetical protein